MRKAKYLKTGETVNVHNIDYCGQGMDVALIEKDGLMKNVSLYDIQFIYSIDEEKVNILTSDIDWENRRYEIAKAAMQAIINIQNYELGWDNNILCSDARNVSDELIKQLKSNEAK